MADITKKDLPGYEGLYTIDINGHIYNKFGYKKKQKKDNNGYNMVTLSNNNKSKRFRVHRIIGKVFIPNPDNKPQINHIDGNKSNNNIKNLEWCTPKENVIHAVKILGKDLGHWRGTKSKNAPASKIIYQYTKNNEFVRKRFCTRDIYRELGIHWKQISRVACGNRKTTAGYKWSFILL